MLRIITVLVLMGIVGLSFGGTTCVTQQNVATLDQIYVNLTAILGATLQDPANPTTEDVQKVFNMTCNDANIRPVIDQIQMIIAECLEIIQSSNIKDLTIGPMKFVDLFAHFSGVDNFCECSSSLIGIMVIQKMEVQLAVMDPNAKYTKAVNFPMMCTPQSAQFPVDMRLTLQTIRNHTTKCPNVFAYNTLLTKTNIDHMVVLVSKCDANAQFNFQCSMNVSRTATFKQCIDNAMTSTSDDAAEQQCDRNACTDTMETSCSADSRTIYLLSVEAVTEGTFRTEDDCSGATSVATTFLLLVSAAILSVVTMY